MASHGGEGVLTLALGGDVEGEGGRGGGDGGARDAVLLHQRAVPSLHGVHGVDVEDALVGGHQQAQLLGEPGTRRR